MNLILNKTDHWVLPGGAELHIGDLVEVQLEGKWVKGQVYYKPRKSYMLQLEDGREMVICSELVIRVRGFYGAIQ
jgi:hypothetical protein